MQVTEVLTRCPNTECLSTFPADDFVKSSGRCPRCSQKMTARDLAVIEDTEKKYKKHQLAGTACGDTFDDCHDRLSALVEDVRSLWNVGSIFRTADGAGFTRLYLTGITGCPPRKEIAKVSLGAEENVSWQFHWNALTVLRNLKDKGVILVALERNENSVPINTFSPPADGRLCLLVGNEVTGLSQEALSVCDIVCDLPMHGVKESLNVAVAFGVAAYSLIAR